jgi:hypothetical protein
MPKITRVHYAIARKKTAASFTKLPALLGKVRFGMCSPLVGLEGAPGRQLSESTLQQGDNSDT